MHLRIIITLSDIIYSNSSFWITYTTVTQWNTTRTFDLRAWLKLRKPGAGQSSSSTNTWRETGKVTYWDLWTRSFRWEMFSFSLSSLWIKNQFLINLKRFSLKKIGFYLSYCNNNSISDQLSFTTFYIIKMNISSSRSVLWLGQFLVLKPYFAGPGWHVDELTEHVCLPLHRTLPAGGQQMGEVAVNDLRSSGCESIFFS